MLSGRREDQLLQLNIALAGTGKCPHCALNMKQSAVHIAVSLIVFIRFIICGFLTLATCTLIGQK